MSDFKIETYKKLQSKIRFHGIQYDRGAPYGYLFSDRETGSSFLIENTEPDYEQAILNRLKRLRESFREGLTYEKIRY